MKKSSFIIAATIVFITVAGRVSTAIGQVAGERHTLPVAVVTADPSNDLYKTLTANYDGVRLCKTLDEAVALRDDVKGVMILADNYPDQRTRVSSEQAEALLASDVRIYVEYPENNDALGIAVRQRRALCGEAF